MYSVIDTDSTASTPCAFTQYKDAEHLAEEMSIIYSDRYDSGYAVFVCKGKNLEPICMIRGLGYRSTSKLNYKYWPKTYFDAFNNARKIHKLPEWIRQ